MTFTLQIGAGSAQALSDLGISAARLTEDAAGQSALELEADHGISAAAIIAPFQKVVLRADGMVRFVGWMDTAPIAARGSVERVVYRLAGPHRWLDNATFTQTRAGLALLGGAAGSGLDQDPGPISAAITEVLTAALAVYSGAFEYTGEDTFTHEIPIERRIDVSCWQALRSLLGYAPTAVLWWTYGSGGDETKPVLHIADGDHAADRTITNDTYEISDAQLNPRYDLLADTVKVYYVKDGSLSSPQISGPAGDANTLGANRARVFTFDAGTLYNVPSAGLAAEIAKWVQKLHIDGSATKLSISWDDHAGDVVGFGGEFTRFASYTTQVYSLTRDLFNQSTTLALGVMPGKGIIPVSVRAEETNSAEKTTGGGGGGSPSPEGTLNINIVENDDLPVSDVTWTTKGASGSGSSSVSVPPGSYTVVAFPLFDVATGKWWFPTGPATASVSDGGSGTANITFATANRIVLKSGSGTVPTIDINADDLAGMAADTIASLRSVERCDGKQSLVLKTDWADPA